MSSSDITEAMAYDRIDPIGQERADFRAGIIASVIANVHKSKSTKPFKPQDFMPEFGKKSENKLMRQIKEVFKRGNPG